MSIQRRAMLNFLGKTMVVFPRRGEAEDRTVGMERSLHDTTGTNIAPTSIKFHCRLRASEGDNQATWKDMLLQKPMLPCANFFCH